MIIHKSFKEISSIEVSILNYFVFAMCEINFKNVQIYYRKKKKNFKLSVQMKNEA